MGKDQKEINELVRKAERAGWRKAYTRSGHIRLTSPEGLAVVMPASAGGHRAYRNVRAKLRRSGLEA